MKRFFSSSSPLRAVLFDLDGTLVDTAPDMVAACNVLRSERGLETPLPVAALRSRVSRGAGALVAQSLETGEDDPQFDLHRQRFLDLYAASLCVKSTLFSGMTDMLRQLHESELKWGVVTNKPRYLAEPLMHALELSWQPGCLTAAGDTEANKPDPSLLLLACDQLQVEPASCLYVGDAASDIQAARAAGMPSVAARYGYILDDDDPGQWQADFVIDQPEELQELVRPWL